MDAKHIIAELNELVEKNHDAANGFRNAVKKVHNHDLRNYLMEHVYLHNQFNSELQQEITFLGGTPRESKQHPATLYQAWMDLKTALSSDKEEAVLEECIRGDKNALHEYRYVLEENDVPEHVKFTVRKQMKKIESSLRNLERMEKHYD